MIFNQKNTQGDLTPKGYHDLTYIQRHKIFILKDKGDSPSKIAKALNVHHTTIGRELKRNSEGIDLFRNLCFNF